MPGRSIGLLSVTGPWMNGLFLLGWVLLGGLLGRGMALLIPNLKPGRAALAGAVGGGLGASAFLATSALLEGTALGETLSRFVGAAILGLAIGSMVALVEVIFRKNWLEVRYGANEVRHVNLGDAPVSIGSNSKACIVWTPVAPPVALTYTLRDGRLTCTDGRTGETEPVLPGDTRKVGSLEIVARGSEAAEVSTAAPYVQPPSRPAMPAATPAPIPRPRPVPVPPPGPATDYAPGPRRCHKPRPGPRRCHNTRPGPWRCRNSRRGRWPRHQPRPGPCRRPRSPNPRRFRRRARFRRTAPRRRPRGRPPTPARLAAVRSRARRRSGTA